MAGEPPGSTGLCSVGIGQQTQMFKRNAWQTPESGWPLKVLEPFQGFGSARAVLSENRSPRFKRLTKFWIPSVPSPQEQSHVSPDGAWCCVGAQGCVIDKKT